MLGSRALAVAHGVEPGLVAAVVADGDRRAPQVHDLDAVRAAAAHSVRVVAPVHRGEHRPHDRFRTVRRHATRIGSRAAGPEGYGADLEPVVAGGPTAHQPIGPGGTAPVSAGRSRATALAPSLGASARVDAPRVSLLVTPHWNRSPTANVVSG